MKYMADEMLEELPEILRKDGIDCRTAHEWIDGAKQKKRVIKDYEIRKFLAKRRAEGEEITLITNDGDSWEQVQADGLPVIYVPNLVRAYILSKRG